MTPKKEYVPGNWDDLNFLENGFFFGPHGTMITHAKKNGGREKHPDRTKWSLDISAWDPRGDLDVMGKNGGGEQSGQP